MSRTMKRPAALRRLIAEATGLSAKDRAALRHALEGGEPGEQAPAAVLVEDDRLCLANSASAVLGDGEHGALYRRLVLDVMEDWQANGDVDAQRLRENTAVLERREYGAQEAETNRVVARWGFRRTRRPRRPAWDHA